MIVKNTELSDSDRTIKAIEETGEAVFNHYTDPTALYVTLARRWSFLAIGGVVGAILGCAVILLSTKSFEASGRIMVIQKTPKFINDETKSPDAKAYDSFFATHLQLIGSPLIVKQAVEHAKLDELPELSQLISEDKTAVDYIKNHLKISRAGSGDADGAFVVKVAFKHISAKESAKVVDEVLIAYKKFIEDSRLDDQEKAVKIVGGLGKVLEDEVAAKETLYREFVEQAPGVWDRESLENAHQTRIVGLQSDLAELQLKKVALESRLKIISRTADPVTGRNYSDLERLSQIDDMHVPRLQLLVSVKSNQVHELLQTVYPERQESASLEFDDLYTLLIERENLAGNLGEDHPKIKDIDAGIKRLESIVKASTARVSGSGLAVDVEPGDILQAYQLLLKEDLADVISRVEFMTQSIVEANESAKTLLTVSLRAERLRSDYQRSLELHQSILEEAKKQSLVDDFGGYIAEIIEFAKKGELVWPKKPIVLAMCGLMGVFVGMMIAVTLDLLPLLTIPFCRPETLAKD